MRRALSFAHRQRTVQKPSGGLRQRCRFSFLAVLLAMPFTVEPARMTSATESTRFDEACARFDAANAEDPRTERAEGVDYPKELLYARRMTERLRAFSPDASEPLQLAARCQHIRRWTIPRSEYPMNRRGYKQWRNALARYHADTAGDILREVGYDEETVEHVQSLLMKKRLKRDPEAQVLEDVVCLVFLEHYFPDFAREHSEEKLIDILQKTAQKMSPAGRNAALALDLSQETRTLLGKALAPGG